MLTVLLLGLVGCAFGQDWETRRFAAAAGTASRFDLAELQQRGLIQPGQDNHLGCCVWLLEGDVADPCEENPFFMKSICQATCAVQDCPFGADVDFEPTCRSDLAGRAAAEDACRRLRTPVFGLKSSTSANDTAAQPHSSSYGAPPQPPPPPPPPGYDDVDPIPGPPGYNSTEVDYSSEEDDSSEEMLDPMDGIIPPGFNGTGTPAPEFPDYIDPMDGIIPPGFNGTGTPAPEIIYEYYGEEPSRRQRSRLVMLRSSLKRTRKNRHVIGRCADPRQEAESCAYMATMYRRPGSAFTDASGNVHSFARGICLNRAFLKVCPCACTAQFRRRNRLSVSRRSFVQKRRRQRQ